MIVRSLDVKGAGESTESRSADLQHISFGLPLMLAFCSGPADAMWELHNPTTRGRMSNSWIERNNLGRRGLKSSDSADWGVDEALKYKSSLKTLHEPH